MIITLLIPILLGWLAGWLVNYLGDTLPISRKLSHPACVHCGQGYPWMEYLLFHRCPNCGQRRRGWRTWVVYISLVALSLYLWLNPGRIGYWIGLLLVVYFAVVVVIDLEYRMILNITSIVGAILGLGIGIFLHGIPVTLIGGATNYGIMLVLYLLGEVFVRYMARRRGEAIDEVALGYGDVNLAGITGLLLGWPGVIIGLLFTILAGGLVSLVVIAIMLLRRRYRAFSAIPYGPFLVLSTAFLLFRP